jgi:sulfur carrier protein
MEVSVNMNILIRLVDGSREWRVEVEGDESIGDILRRLGLNPEEYIVVVNGELVTIQDKVRDGSVITLYPVVSGG